MFAQAFNGECTDNTLYSIIIQSQISYIQSEAACIYVLDELNKTLEIDLLVVV